MAMDWLIRAVGERWMTQLQVCDAWEAWALVSTVAEAEVEQRRALRLYGGKLKLLDLQRAGRVIEVRRLM
jgi:hypothetical protein